MPANPAQTPFGYYGSSEGYSEGDSVFSTHKLALWIVAFAMMLTCLSLNAAYLSNMPMSITQPDGKVIECYATGDEFHNWLHDKDNYTIIRNPNTGYYCYAESGGAQVIAGDLVVGKDNPQSRGLKPGINLDPEVYQARRKALFQAPVTRDAPTIGTINNVVIYIRFSDETEFGENISTYDGWFNSGTSSQKNYYLEASYNQLTVNTSFFPAPSNNMVVSWQDSHPRAYFQPYDASTNPTGYQTDDESRTREFTLLQNACAGVGSSIPSGLNIDSDNDGRVDNVVFIVRGSAGAWSSLLWPHRWSIWDRYVYINGKRVYDFNLQLQTFLASRGVGVICHEFFHTLGAPDLYHYTSNGITPAGSWDIMQSDQNPPQHMTAFMKWKYGDWISSIPTITTDQLYTLNPLTSSTGNAYRINSNNANQYYIVEFRKKTGTFESSIPGSGLLIYRIDTSAGDGNAGGPPDELYIYRPGGTTSVDGTISSANYSAEVGRVKINNTTNPTPFLQDGSAGNLTLYGIGSSAGATMSFYKGVPPIVTIGFSPNPQTEYFDAATYIPDGWENQAVVGSQIFERVTNGGSPTCSPQTGSGMLRYNSYSASSGNAAFLSSPRINCSNIVNYSYSFSFWMYRDTGYSSYADKMEVYLNTTQNLSGSPTLLGTINRYIGMAPTVASAGWYQYSYNLSLPAGGYYYIVLKAISAYGNNMFVDSFSFTRSITSPSPAINPSPANAASGINYTQALSWQSGSANTDGYKLYLGTNNPPTNLVNGSSIGNVLSYTYSRGMPLGTTVYWKIVPTNMGVEASNCPVWSFSTVADYSTFPLTEAFGSTGTSFPPTNWTRYAGVLADPSTLATNTGLWVQDDWLNTTTSPANFCARNNIYGSSRYGWMISPLLNIPTGAMLSIDLGLTDYANSNPISSDPSGTTGTDDQFAILIGDGVSWSTANLVRKWDNAGSSYVYNNISATGEKVLIDLSAYPGYKYLAFYGASATSNADNDLFVDNISVQTKPVTAQALCSISSWNVGARELNSSISKQVTVYNTGGGTLNISSINVSGSSAFTLQSLPSFPQSLAFAGSFSFTVNFLPTSTGDHSATIYINGNSSTSIALSGSSVDPRIASLPHSENFDSVIIPALPLGWRAYLNSSSTSASVSTGTSYPTNGLNSVALSNSSDTAADVRLICPEVLVPLNGVKLKFYAKGSSTAYTLLVGTVANADGSGTFTQIASLNLSDAQTEYSVSFGTYSGSDRYIAIKHGLGGTYRTIYMDDFRLEALLNEDLGIVSFGCPVFGNSGASMDYPITVVNNGLQTQSSYTLRLMTANRSTELVSLSVNSPLQPDATVMHSLTWVPANPGSYELYAELIFTGDGNTANNLSSTGSTTIYPSDTYQSTAGDLQSTSSANTLPLSMYWKNSLSETIYLTEELQMASGNILAMVYKYNFVQELNNKPVKIWVKNTVETDLSISWSSFDGYTLVFDGTLNFAMGQHQILIPFATPFAYTGANLAVRVNRPMDTAYFNSSNHFYYTDSTLYPNRSRYMLSDSESYDPSAPSVAGTLSNSIPVSIFLSSGAKLGTPMLSMQQEGTSLVLRWNAVPGAAVYRIYASATPSFLRDTPVAETSQLSYTVPNGSKMFYRVVAASAASSREAMRF